jgi:hypothetical protein
LEHTQDRRDCGRKLNVAADKATNEEIDQNSSPHRNKGEKHDDTILLNAEACIKLPTVSTSAENARRSRGKSFTIVLSPLD